MLPDSDTLSCKLIWYKSDSFLKVKKKTHLPVHKMDMLTC